MRVGRGRLWLGLVLSAAPACVRDVVLPNEQATATCGNGVLEAGEECDTASAGCVACTVAPTWTCDAEGCAPICGDGVVGDGARCASPRREASCDLTGYWIARQSTYLRETILGGLQVSSNWFFLRLAQEGDAFVVLEALDCGIAVTGSASVRYTPSSLRAILNASGMDGRTGRPPRRGTSRATPGGCAFTFDRWYAVRGLSDAFLPADPSAKPALDALPPLPTVSDPVTSTERPEGVTDPDGDGIPGLAFQLEGIAAGVRNSAQRDWKEYATPEGASVPASALTFEVPGAFDLQESILRVTECGAACGLLASGARVAQDVPPRIAFSYLGRDLEGPRVSRVARRAPGASAEDDLATCAKVRLVLPHDPGVP